MRRWIAMLWRLLDPPGPVGRPIVERYPALRCGTAVAEAWVDLTHLGLVVRARRAANEAARRAGHPAPYGEEAPEWPRWCPWQRPERRAGA